MKFQPNSYTMNKDKALIEKEKISLSSKSVSLKNNQESVYSPESAEPPQVSEISEEKNNEHVHLSEDEKEKNLKIKNGLLDRLRTLLSGEETNTSIDLLKEIQESWKNTGPVPASYNQELWANYNALVERFYNNRSIYFELKELDRKKNLETKTELCEKAEKLAESNDVGQALRELKSLHEEYKHIGPVPKEDQEALWERFKKASDKIYSRRAQYLEELKKNLFENLEKKKELAEKMAVFADFNTERIDEWKVKTAEVLELQNEWKNTGSLPADKSKDVSKKFWGACKAFFHNKDQFFRQLEVQKEENLKLKVELCEQAEKLKDNEDLAATANVLKELQKKWEAIGPVPVKEKEAIYKRFKEACDHFFNRKRESAAETEKEYSVNLQKKNEVCEKIEALAEDKNKDTQKIKSLQNEWKEIGFVPRSEMKNINDRYHQAINKYLSSLDGISETEKQSLREESHPYVPKNRPAAGKRFPREHELSKKINALKNEINTLNTNMEFFARSAAADKLKKEIVVKIEKAREEMDMLKSQLEVLRKV